MTDLLRLEGLEVHFPVRGGFLDRIRRRAPLVVRAVDGIRSEERRCRERVYVLV